MRCLCLLDNSNIIDESFEKGVDLIQSYGWLVIFTAVALYFAYPFIEVIRESSAAFHSLAVSNHLIIASIAVAYTVHYCSPSGKLYTALVRLRYPNTVSPYPTHRIDSRKQVELEAGSPERKRLLDAHCRKVRLLQQEKLSRSSSALQSSHA